MCVGDDDHQCSICVYIKPRLYIYYTNSTYANSIDHIHFFYIRAKLIIYICLWFSIRVNNLFSILQIADEISRIAISLANFVRDKFEYLKRVAWAFRAEEF